MSAKYQVTRQRLFQEHFDHLVNRDTNEPNSAVILSRFSQNAQRAYVRARPEKERVPVRQALLERDADLLTGILFAEVGFGLLRRCAAEVVLSCVTGAWLG